MRLLTLPPDALMSRRCCFCHYADALDVVIFTMPTCWFTPPLLVIRCITMVTQVYVFFFFARVYAALDTLCFSYFDDADYVIFIDALLMLLITMP